MRRPPLVATTTLATLAVLAVLPLGDGLLLDGLHGVGYCVCHQIASHSLFLDGHQLPLCARCTGIYLGFLTGILGMAILGKQKAAGLPPVHIIAALFAVFGIMVVDGFNSLASFFPDAPLLYQPTNLLRLVTGAAAGCSLALLLLPSLNDSLWRTQDRAESVSDLGELGGYAVLVALVVTLVYSQQPWLLYPVAAVSILGVFAALSMAATTVVIAATRREGSTASWAGATPLLLAGLGLSGVAMAAVGIARALLTQYLGL